MRRNSDKEEVESEKQKTSSRKWVGRLVGWLM